MHAHLLPAAPSVLLAARHGVGDVGLLVLLLLAGGGYLAYRRNAARNRRGSGPEPEPPVRATALPAVPAAAGAPAPRRPRSDDGDLAILTDGLTKRFGDNV